MRSFQLLRLASKVFTEWNELYGYLKIAGPSLIAYQITHPYTIFFITLFILKEIHNSDLYKKHTIDF